ncbi:methylenetetrahydrofolate reductase (NADPH) [Brevibacterium iodinum ATCC 49514]|uniref:Methylenetetrahydrofolate reductase n=1 Tax=Brevibacterium iodinum ATCC 49514 TaxID=1255616 RepID=A0A2H1J9X8_9MICO|nr:methylenetetrahydrofolate reductase [Brevibacterium iodinum]SMX84305.1 methylenetetrahydrofolate reductase (NADPH) [Brevibacterium iodinum ATCC 49514]SUW11106.1 5,10-methylenetetrahydrofolate reductase [Brevibacterium iodinum]
MTLLTIGSRELLKNFSLEMTAKDTESLETASRSIPAGTAVNLTYLANETTEMRIEAAQAIVDAGLSAVPHISARRLTSADELRDYLERLSAVGAVERLFLVGGDPSTPVGPFPDALSVIRSGRLGEFGVREVGITGYPEGHPDIAEATLWDALEQKLAALDRAGIEASVTTQVSFDSTAVAKWIAEVRGWGIEVPIRVGVPGPAGIKRLLGFARRLGVSANAALLKKYGASVTNLLGKSTPATFIERAAEEFARENVGDVRIHFYTFGGLVATAGWTRDYLADSGRRESRSLSQGESDADAS